MQVLPAIKRGDTFAFMATLTDHNGNPYTGKANYLKSQVRDANDRLYANLTITETDTLGTYLFKADSTDNWAITTLYLDIQINENGVITSSDTISISVERDVTRNG